MYYTGNSNFAAQYIAVHVDPPATTLINKKTPINFQVGLQQLTAVMSGLEGNI